MGPKTTQERRRYRRSQMDISVHENLLQHCHKNYLASGVSKKHVWTKLLEATSLTNVLHFKCFFCVGTTISLIIIFMPSLIYSKTNKIFLGHKHRAVWFIEIQVICRQVLLSQFIYKTISHCNQWTRSKFSVLVRQ